MSAQAAAEIVRVYVWEVPVRITHWLIALSIVVLSATGLYIGHPFLIVSGEARQHFVMGWAKAIHMYTAYAFMASVVARIIWMFTGNKYAHWDKFIPVRPERRRALWPTVYAGRTARQRMTDESSSRKAGRIACSNSIPSAPRRRDRC